MHEFHAGERMQFQKFTNGSSDFDKRRFVGDFLSSLNSFFNGIQIVVTIADCLCMPAIGIKALVYIFSEGESSITINCNLVVVI